MTAVRLVSSHTSFYKLHGQKGVVFLLTTFGTRHAKRMFFSFYFHFLVLKFEQGTIATSDLLLLKINLQIKFLNFLNESLEILGSTHKSTFE
jgi:hypothetical protein